MNEGFYRSNFIPPEDRNLHRLKGDVDDNGDFADLVEDMGDLIEVGYNYKESNKVATKGIGVSLKDALLACGFKESKGVFDDFLILLRQKGVKVSTPEWMQFLSVVKNIEIDKKLEGLVDANNLMNRIKILSRITLIKNKSDETIFDEAFEEYFGQIIKKYESILEEECGEIVKNDDAENCDFENSPKEDSVSKESDITDENDAFPEIKDSLGIDVVDDNLDFEKDGKEDDVESVHGGKDDQHNDILKKEDLSKQGGGDEKDKSIGGNKGLLKEKGVEEDDKDEELFPDAKNKNQEAVSREIPGVAKNIQQEKEEYGYLIGGGKGNSVFADRIQQDSIYNGKELGEKDIEERKKRVGKIDRRLRYEERPDRVSMREVIRNIRRIILDVSEVKSKNINLNSSINNFAKLKFKFEYKREREQQSDMVLFIDVGGPVDEWSPLIKEIAETMVDGLTKLEVYLFHNNLYGYVWKPNQKDLLASSYAKPNSLIDVKSIIKKRKKVIIYGDAEMSCSEFKRDAWPPNDNGEMVKRFGMGGVECLNFIKKKSDSVVWINPIFKKEWEDRDDSGTIGAVGEIVSMHDLTVGGVEDAIRELMKR